MEDFPYLLDVQADLLADLRSRVVVRLIPAAAVASALGDRLASLADEGPAIIGAIDFLLTGT